MTAAPIRFYLDDLSSNAYLAWETLPAIAARNGRAVEAVPTLLAGLLGVPAMIVDGVLISGYDDFSYLERFLAGRGSLDPKSLEVWSGPPRRSATRNQHRERI